MIGKIEEKEKGIMLEDGGEFKEVEPPYADEIYKVVGKE